MDAGLQYCKQNKPELYQKAEEGKLAYFPGLDEAFDIPDNAKLQLKPEQLSENIQTILSFLQQQEIFPVD